MKEEAKFMVEYLTDLPYFLFFVVLGIVVNFLYVNSGEKIPRIRIFREFIGGLWISLIIFGIIDEFFNLSRLFLYIICSLAGFGNSRILDFLKKDFFEFAIGQGQQAIKNLVGRLKSRDNEEDNYHYPPYPHRDGGDEETDITDENEYR